MSRENPDEHLDKAMEAEAPGTEAPTKRPDEFAVRTQRIFESWEHPKGRDGKPDVGKAPVKLTKLVNGEIGPFRNRAIAEQVAAGMANLESTISAVVITVVDGPDEVAAEKQAPASAEVIAEMIKQGKFEGVPADATVRVEGEPQAAAAAPDNTVPFPTQPGAAEGSSET